MKFVTVLAQQNGYMDVRPGIICFANRIDFDNLALSGIQFINVM